MSEWCYFLQICADNGTDKYKIGRTGNFDRRYDVQTRSKDPLVEHELIQAYRAAG